MVSAACQILARQPAPRCLSTYHRFDRQHVIAFVLGLPQLVLHRAATVRTPNGDSVSSRLRLGYGASRYQESSFCRFVGGSIPKSKSRSRGAQNAHPESSRIRTSRFGFYKDASLTDRCRFPDAFLTHFCEKIAHFLRVLTG